MVPVAGRPRLDADQAGRLLVELVRRSEARTIDPRLLLDQVPGAFLMLGACPPDVDPFSAAFNHSAEAVFDDAILADGTALYAELALRRLAAS